MRAIGRFVAVVLLQMGGPESVDHLEPFLESLFSDRDIIQLPAVLRPFQGFIARRIAKRRAPKMAVRYREIGGGSPLNRITQAQADGLALELGVRGNRRPVLVANRYTAPRPAVVLGALEAMGSPDVTLLTLYPHWSKATTASSERDFLAEAERRSYAGAIDSIDRWGEHPSYISLLAGQIRRQVAALATEHGLAPDDIHVLFTAHGLPQRYVDAGDPYPTEVSATASKAASAAGLRQDGWSQSYQSAVGPVEWLRPYSDEHVRELAAKGVRGIVFVPLGFVSDHIETLYDVDILLIGIARELGVPSTRLPSFNADPWFAATLADVLRDVPRRMLRPRGPPADPAPQAMRGGLSVNADSLTLNTVGDAR
ncbi:MAG: ferrochelatase [Thermoplasmatota archaeon]